MGVQIIELLENDIHLGYAPIIDGKTMLLENGKPLVRKTKKEAKEEGNKHKLKTENE